MGAGGSITSNSTENWSDERLRQKFLIRAFNTRRVSGQQSSSLHEQIAVAFHRFDRDGNGTISREEFQLAISG